jgi:hypothetical protein
MIPVPEKGWVIVEFLVYQLVYHMKGKIIEVNYGLPHTTGHLGNSALDPTL